MATDWKSPSGNTLARMADQRVRQFWDSNHVVAEALNNIAKRNPTVSEPSCCVQKGFYWDDAILYVPHTHWRDRPTSVFWNGPVARIISGLEKALNDQPQGQSPRIEQE